MFTHGSLGSPSLEDSSAFCRPEIVSFSEGCLQELTAKVFMAHYVYVSQKVDSGYVARQMWTGFSFVPCKGQFATTVRPSSGKASRPRRFRGPSRV